MFILDMTMDDGIVTCETIRHWYRTCRFAHGQDEVRDYSSGVGMLLESSESVGQVAIFSEMFTRYPWISTRISEIEHMNRDEMNAPNHHVIGLIRSTLYRAPLSFDGEAG